MIITFFSGASFIMVSFIVYFIVTPSSSGYTNYDDLEHTMSVIRFGFIIDYILFATGLAIKILQEKGINYLYIFECDPHYKMTHFQFYKVSVVIFFILTSCFCGQLMTITLDYMEYTYPTKYLFFLVLFLLVYCCQPLFRCGYRTARS